jgi:hypothetical protein
MYHFYAPKNKVHESIVHDLSKLDYPDQSQIIILNGNRIPTGGWWNYSSGYIKYATGRKDLTGIVGKEYFYYDPFVAKNRGFDKSDNMNGVDLSLPVYIYKLECKSNGCHLNQLKYALQWNEGPWSLITFDMRSGEIVNSIKGSGYNDLANYLVSHNISFSQVAFSKMQ